MNSDGGSLFKKRLMNNIIEYAYPQLEIFKNLPAPNGYEKCEACKTPFKPLEVSYATVSCEVKNCNNIVFCDALWCGETKNACNVCKRVLCKSTHTFECVHCHLLLCNDCPCPNHSQPKKYVRVYHPTSKRARLTNWKKEPPVIPEITKNCEKCWNIYFLYKKLFGTCDTHADCYLCSHGAETVCDTQLVIQKSAQEVENNLQ